MNLTPLESSAAMGMLTPLLLWVIMRRSRQSMKP